MIPCYDRGLIMEDFVCEDFKFYLTKSQGHFKRGMKAEDHQTCWTGTE